jgi:hypothetical protein
LGSCIWQGVQFIQCLFIKQKNDIDIVLCPNNSPTNVIPTDNTVEDIQNHQLPDVVSKSNLRHSHRTIKVRDQQATNNGLTPSNGPTTYTPSSDPPAMTTNALPKIHEDVEEANTARHEPPVDVEYPDNPRNWHEALSINFKWNAWIKGAEEELSSLKEMSVYKLVPRSSVPATCRILNGHFVCY